MAPIPLNSAVDTSIISTVLQKAPSFTLLSLPAENRLRILEYLLHDLRFLLDHDDHDGEAWNYQDACLVEDGTFRLPIGIFQTCHCLRYEALTVLRQKSCLYMEARWNCGAQLATFIPLLHPLLVPECIETKDRGRLVLL